MKLSFSVTPGGFGFWTKWGLRKSTAMKIICGYLAPDGEQFRF